MRMVESYFDKAGRHTNIRPDKLNFYKKAENVVKCSITLIRGTKIVISKMMENYKLSQLIGVSIKDINFQPKVEQDLL